MSTRSNFISKGRIFIRKGIYKIRFGLFGTSLAFPAVIFDNCSGSCGNCYKCLASAAPLIVMTAMLFSRKVQTLKKGKSDPETNVCETQTKNF